jgi:hypothetical protein
MEIIQKSSIADFFHTRRLTNEKFELDTKFFFRVYISKGLFKMRLNL